MAPISFYACLKTRWNDRQAGWRRPCFSGPANNASSYLDVAGFAAASVDNPAARNIVVKLGGPEALSPLQVVEVFEERSGREFTVTHVPEEALRAQRAAAADSLQEAFAALMLYYARGDVIDIEPALRIFPLKASELVSIRDYVVRGAQG
jgi:uncharacterized protein YbjT (DUF2867 family)